MGLAQAPLARPLGQLALGPPRAGRSPLQWLERRVALSSPLLARCSTTMGLG